MNKILFFFTVIILLSCAGGSKTSENTDAIADEDVKLPITVFMEDFIQKEDTEPLSSVASEIVYIPLETNDNSLLKKIDRIEKLGDNYAVSDFENIFLFDQNGKFIKRVARKGGGPSDYTTWVYNIIVDPSTNFLYLFTYNKVIKFDEKANYITNFQIDGIRIGDVYPNGVVTQDKTIMLGLLNDRKKPGDTNIVYNALEVDTIGHTINKYINYSPRYSQIRTVSHITALYKFNNDIRFMDFLNDTLFLISGDSMMPYVIYDFGKNKFKFIEDNLSYRDNFDALHEALNNLNGNFVKSVFENDNFLFMCISKKGVGVDIVNCLYNKRTKKVKLLKDGGLLNDLDGSLSFFPQKTFKDNELVRWKSAEEFKEEILSLDYNAQKAKYGERFEKVYQVAKSLLEDDNPVLIIAKK